HLGAAGHRHTGNTGARRDILGGQWVGAAQEQLDVAVAQNLLPLVLRVAVLQPGQALKHAGNRNAAGTEHGDPPGQYRDGAAGGDLLGQHVDGDRKPPALAVAVGIAHQLDEHKREKQRGQKVEGTVLVAGHKKVGAGFLAGQLQVDLLGAGDLTDQLRLEDLQPGAEPDDDAAAHRVRSLLKQVEGALGRVLDRQYLKHLPQFGIRTLGQQAVDLPDVALLRRVAQIDI